MELFKDLLFKGGPINLILFGAYGIVLIIIVERLLFFMMKRGRYHLFMSRLRTQLDDGQSSIMELDINQTLPYSNSFYFQLTRLFQTYTHLTPEEREKLLLIFMSECKTDLERGLTVVSIIGTLSPMMGLLGTMLGLVRSFRGIEAMGGAVNISVLAGGIWEAMLTTIAGLIVGIVALLALKLFQSRIVLVANRLEDLAMYLDVKLSSR